MRIRTNLLPLLSEGKDDENTREAIKDAILELVKDIHASRERRVTAIVGSDTIPISPITKDSPLQYPIMKQYHIPIQEARVHQSLLKELYQLNRKYFESRSMAINLGNNKQSTFVLVPRSNGYSRLQLNESRYKWFEVLMSALGGQGNEADTARDLFVHVSWIEKFRESIFEAVAQSGIRTFPQFDPIATFAMQSAANLNETQLTILR